MKMMINLMTMLKKNKFDIFENENNYVLYNISSSEERDPDLGDQQTKGELTELVFQKNKFEYNRKLLEKITQKEFGNNDFIEIGKDKIQSIKLNSIRDNKKFEINSVEVLYSLPENSFTLVNDEKNTVYLVKIKKFYNKTIDENDDKFNDYAKKKQI